MSDDKKDILSKYTRQPYPALVKAESTENKKGESDGENDDENEKGYHALVEHREKRASTPRFRIIDRNGRHYGCGYAYLIGWLYSPPDTLSIYTTSHVFTLSGSGLVAIEKALLRKKVLQLREFNDSKDEKPKEGEPIITRLHVESRFEKE